MHCGARGSARRPRGPAPRPPQPTPTPPGRAGPAKPRTRKAHALAHAAVTQKIWLRPHVGPSWRGRVATLPPRSEPHTRSPLPKGSHPHARHTPRLRIETAQARATRERPIESLRGRRRHPRHQAQRQEGGRALRQDHEPHQEALLRPRLEIHQAERATSASFPHVSELQVAATASTRRHVFMKPSS